MTSKKFPVIGGHTMRVTIEDACGVPDWGDETQLVTDGFVSVAPTANYEDGTEKSITNARGRKCVRRPAESEFVDLTLAITFCDVDPALYTAVTGAPRVVDAETGDIIGFDLDTSVRSSDVHYGLEVWSDGYDVLDCDDSDEVPYGYFLWPGVNGGRVGDYTLEDAAVTFSITDAHTFGGAGWAAGPYEVTRDENGDPSVLLDALTKNKHQRVFRTTVAPPEVTDGLVPLDDPTDPAATTATAGSPGTFNGVRPANLAGMSGITASPSTDWTTGQHVILGDGSFANWNATAWVAGKSA